MKKLIFLLMFLALPVGAKAQEIIKCDTTKALKCHNEVFIRTAEWREYDYIPLPLKSPYADCETVITAIKCDTSIIQLGQFLLELRDYTLDSGRISPDWRDSIEACKNRITSRKIQVNNSGIELDEVLAKKNVTLDELVITQYWYSFYKHELNILELQLQIFQLQQKLQKVGIQ